MCDFCEFLRARKMIQIIYLVKKIGEFKQKRESERGRVRGKESEKESEKYYW